MKSSIRMSTIVKAGVVLAGVVFASKTSFGRKVIGSLRLWSGGTSVNPVKSYQAYRDKPMYVVEEEIENSKTRLKYLRDVMMKDDGSSLVTAEENRLKHLNWIREKKEKGFL